MTLDRKGTFYKLQNVGIPVNSQNDDFAFTMNKNNLTGYFSSNRIGGKGDDDIYSYTLTKPLPKQLIVEGIISDEKTGEIFDATMWLIAFTIKISVIGLVIYSVIRFVKWSWN